MCLCRGPCPQVAVLTDRLSKSSTLRERRSLVTGMEERGGPCRLGVDMCAARGVLKVEAHRPTDADAEVPSERPMTVWRIVAVVLIVLGTTVQPLGAQESVGRRVFSDQLVISEPFVEDEVSVPSILHLKRGRSAG